jgi:pimeloyl-ACP methyl ester carboxylesterase
MKTIRSDAGATLSYDVIGHGTCLLALHGAYSTHDELAAVLEPILGPHGSYRRLYPDLPGMGTSPAHTSIQSSNDVLDLLEDLVDDQAGDAPLLVVGHSYGAHLARGLAARRPRQIRGMALICPLMPGGMNPERHAVVRSDIDPAELLDPALVDDYLGYFVIYTEETAQRFNEAVAPSIGRFDGDAVVRIMREWILDPDPDAVEFDGPLLVMTGRHDSVVGYREQAALVDRYPKATYLVLAGTGHALPHERPELTAALIADWLASI